MEFPVTYFYVRIRIIQFQVNFTGFVDNFLHLWFGFSADDKGNVYGTAVSFNNIDGFEDRLSITLVQFLGIGGSVLLEGNIIDRPVFCHQNRVGSGNIPSFATEGNGFCPGILGFFKKLLGLGKLKPDKARSQPDKNTEKDNQKSCITPEFRRFSFFLHSLHSFLLQNAESVFAEYSRCAFQNKHTRAAAENQSAEGEQEEQAQDGRKQH